MRASEPCPAACSQQDISDLLAAIAQADVLQAATLVPGAVVAHMQALPAAGDEGGQGLAGHTDGRHASQRAPIPSTCKFSRRPFLRSQQWSVRSICSSCLSLRMVLCAAYHARRTRPALGLTAAHSQGVRRVAGITICSTIHSPTPYCFRLFDRMMILLRGQVVYFGQRGVRRVRTV